VIYHNVLRNLFKYGVIKHVGFIVNGTLVSMYPEPFKLFRKMAGKVYEAYVKAAKENGEYLFLEIGIETERILVYPVSKNELIFLHLSKDASVELIIDEVIRAFRKKPGDLEAHLI